MILEHTYKWIFSIIGSNIIFNIIEYFSFINLFLLFLFIIISLFFILIHSTLLYYSTIHFNHSTIEFISTLLSLLFLIIIISPALIILMDYDLIIIPSYIIYALGLQWAWQFNIIFQPLNIGFDSYCDHYIISMINKETPIGPSLIERLALALGIKTKDYRIVVTGFYKCRMFIRYNQWSQLFNFVINPNISKYDILHVFYPNISKYLFDISQYILLPLYSFVRLFVYSFDVIHTLGIYSWGVKIDAIPGRINVATTLRLLILHSLGIID